MPALPTHEQVASTALSLYAALPQNGKPHRRSSGPREWTVLAAFVLLRPSCAPLCVSLGTGLKVLPHARLPKHGDVLHDSHAEVVARRGMGMWLAGELQSAVQGKESALEAKGDHGWRLKDGCTVAMYVSLQPCGDASTYFLSLTAPPSPPSLSPSLDSDSANPLLHDSPHPSPTAQVYRGRNSYSISSTLRTKPGRRDSPPSTSHSCSDKLARWALLGLQGALLSSLGVEPIKIALLVVGGVQAPLRAKVGDELARAVARRVGVDPPHIGFSALPFPDDRTSPADASCPESLSFVRGSGTEVLVNGIRQGASSKRKDGQPLGIKARSRLSKLAAFQRFENLRALLDPEASPARTYYDAKRRAETYQREKDVARAQGGGLEGWLVSGSEFEQLRVDGTVE